MTDTTQMISGVDCAVCGAANSAGAEWCVDCGFRLASTPGEAGEAARGYVLFGAGETLPLKRGENVVGRIQADVFLSDPSVSRRHAVIAVGDDGVFVRDEGSSNGTKVGSDVLEPGEVHPVQPGEAIQVGTVVFRLSTPEGEAAEGPEVEAIPDTGAAGRLEGDLGVFPLKPGANSLGRRAGNDVVLPDPYVSGLHAVITVSDQGATISDAGSSNGTFIGERRLEPNAEEELPAGQEVRFGRATLVYTPAEPAPEAEGTEADAAG